MCSPAARREKETVGELEEKSRKIPDWCAAADVMVTCSRAGALPRACSGVAGHADDAEEEVAVAHEGLDVALGPQPR